MQDTIGVALVGLDHWYSAFMVLDAIKAEKRMRLVGIADSSAQYLEEARSEYSPEVATKEWRQLLDLEAVDLVFSFVPTAKNAEVCLESLGRGIPTLCVKPSAMTVEDANRLASASEDAGVFFSSFEVSHRLTARARFLKKILREGVIGEPVSFYHVAHGGLPQPWRGKSGDSWWLDPAQAPGGAWMDHAIYAVDQLRWTFEREVDLVSGVFSNRRHKELRMEDHGVVWMRLDSGITAVMEDTWTADSGTRFDRFIGTEGSLYPDGDDFVVITKGETQRLTPPEEGPSPFEQIAAAVRGESQLPFKSTCCVHNLAACLAAYESHRTGRHVNPSL